MSPAESAVARLPRLGQSGDASARTSSKPPRLSQRKPGGMWTSVRGTLLYPAILVGLSIAVRLVSRKKDELR
ncbi:hypothetical protein PX554_00320 [Sphingomonas sp. H39-1-10]|uniref:hypothetical protein n=1 Tax=Sphingomonas TaxID=13687 RepID=UPI000890BD51|nr:MULTISPECIES: hypothetical protein [Sphingomonas]MDF0486558.1 hypothetical protein [Sphingomonas pollutisoli]SDA22665.1 hypothetical protein SAMN03159340_01620 [Sphingomonas sp. NFR15]